jgi:gamma-glutamyltranspeptidase / glutathione hydrolase
VKHTKKRPSAVIPAPTVERRARRYSGFLCLCAGLVALGSPAAAQDTAKPVLHGKHWVAVTGKPLAATAGAMIFAKGGNAVDATCAMLAAVTTMWDTLGWGGETLALVYDPHTQQVKAINAMGMAPTGATPEFFLSRGLPFPPGFGPLAAVTPGTPGGLMVMLAEYGTMSLEQVLGPALEMAAGYPMERSQAQAIEQRKRILLRWPASGRVFLPHYDPAHPEAWAAPYPGEVFRQPELSATLRKLVDAEREALAAGRSRKAAIMAAYDRFYRGDIAADLVAATRAAGGLITLDDLASWKVRIEEPSTTTYKGMDVYKFNQSMQGPVLLQTLNILEHMDLKGMGYNSARYIHALYQAMNLSFADRDFYYGDAGAPPEEPMAGLLSKDYAGQRFAGIDWRRNDPNVRPGDPYPFQNGRNPYSELLQRWPTMLRDADGSLRNGSAQAKRENVDEAFFAGTTSIQAADEEGWLVSVTPSGGWIPAFIAGTTGIGLSERMQSFVLSEDQGPFNVLAPGKRPRATLSPSIVLKDKRPLFGFSQQGGDAQDQNLLQFFLDVVEFGMDIQQAAEAANFNSYQMHASFGDHRAEPGRLVLRDDVPAWTRDELAAMGYRIETWPSTSGPTTAIYVDQQHGTLWGAASNSGDDYGIAW